MFLTSLVGTMFTLKLSMKNARFCRQEHYAKWIIHPHFLSLHLFHKDK